MRCPAWKRTCRPTIDIAQEPASGARHGSTSNKYRHQPNKSVLSWQRGTKRIRTPGRTAGWTPDRSIDPALHSKRAVPKPNNRTNPSLVNLKMERIYSNKTVIHDAKGQLCYKTTYLQKLFILALLQLTVLLQFYIIVFILLTTELQSLWVKQWKTTRIYNTVLKLYQYVHVGILHHKSKSAAEILLRN